MSGFDESILSPAAANLAFAPDDFDRLRETGRIANNGLCGRLDGVFAEPASYYSPERVAEPLAGFAETIVYEAPERHTSYRIGNGNTSLLTYGRGSATNVLVSRAEGKANAYKLLYIRGYKEDPGFPAEHTLAEYELDSEDDLVRTLDAQTAWALLSPAGVGGAKQDGPLLSRRPSRHGSLNYETMYSPGAVLDRPEQTGQLLEAGITLSNEACRLIDSIGALRPRRHEQAGFGAAFMHRVHGLGQLAARAFGSA